MFYRDNLLSKSNNSSESGFIILTIPVILALFGFFVTAMINDTKPNQFYFEQATQEKMEDVRLALAAYVHRNYRMPCPARPELDADVRGSEGARNGDNVCSDIKGILPFRELGLPESAAKDEWGNYLTYKVSLDFTRKFDAANFDRVATVGAPPATEDEMLTATTGSENSLHELCRTGNWLNVSQGNYRTNNGDEKTITPQTVNHHLYKAKFCCASIINVGNSSTFTAASQTLGPNQKTVNLVSDSGVSDQVIMSIEALDTDIAIWDESINRNNGRPHSDRMDQWARSIEDEVFAYNSDFAQGNSDEDELGDGLGLLRDGSPNKAGKFHHAAAVFDIQEDNVDIREFTMTMGDINDDNEFSPVEARIDVVDDEGNLIETVGFVLQLPETGTGMAELTFSLDAFLGEATQDGFFHSETRDPRTSTYGGIELPASAAEDFFNDSKQRLNDALEAAGLTLNDVEIGRLKLNATHSSLGFSQMVFGSPTGMSNTDLVIQNENGQPRIEPRVDMGSYSGTDIPHVGSVSNTFEAAAYALISHGENGEGAYEAGKELPRNNIDDALENPREVANHTHSTLMLDMLTVTDMRKVISDDPAEAFDDIVVWDSQITLFNALRNGTCEASQAI